MIGKVLGHNRPAPLKGTPTSPPTPFALWRTGRLLELFAEVGDGMKG
jgi:hypothetical protein